MINKIINFFFFLINFCLNRFYFTLIFFIAFMLSGNVIIQYLSIKNQYYKTNINTLVIENSNKEAEISEKVIQIMNENKLGMLIEPEDII